MSKPRAPKRTRAPYTTDSPSAAYKHFLRAAKQVVDTDVKICKADVDSVRHNIDRGLAAVTPRLATVRDRLPLCPITQILELPALGLALGFACDRVSLPAASGAAEIRDRMWTLLSARYEDLREAGLVLYGLRALDEHIPMLGTRSLTKAVPPAKETMPSAKDAAPAKGTAATAPADKETAPAAPAAKPATPPVSPA